MIFIEASSSVSYQDSFRNPDFYKNLRKLEPAAQMALPDYKEFIPANALRRLSPSLRNGVTAATDCMNQIDGEAFDAIIVGTGLGCLVDTEKFLTTVHTVTGDFLPPTSFIQSTHNTIGGQISLSLGNHAYNMTHTQNSLSFEISLIDAMLCVAEGKQHVLVGAAEEEIPFLEQLKPVVIQTDRQLTSGASFFSVTGQPKPIGIPFIRTWFGISSVEEKLTKFMEEQGKQLAAFDLILHSGVGLLENLLNAQDYQDYSGFYYTNAAFAVAMGESFMKTTPGAKNVLIVNNVCAENLGIIILTSHEA